MKKLFITVIILSFGVYVNGAIIYVKPGGTGVGSSWAAAFGSLQSALQIAVSGDQIWVAQGTYLPSNIGNIDTSFYLENGVAVYGGFAGTETTLAVRADTTGVLTILSGDLGSGLHSNHVVYGVSTLDSTAILNGFTVSGGVYAVSGSDIYDGGAGMYNTGSPSLANIIFKNNTLNITITGSAGTLYGGGGGILTKSGNLKLSNVLFINNAVNTTGCGGCGYGGAGCGGGGLYVDSGNVSLLNCEFNGNSAICSIGGGGGMLVTGIGTTTITNSLFIHNSISGPTGGGLLDELADVVVTNTTFSGNDDYTVYNADGNLTLQNCIVYGPSTWGNVYNSYGTLTTNYCLLLGTFPGTGNLNSAYYGGYPKFMDSASGNYSLTPCSPAINAGNNSYNSTLNDLAGRSRIYGTIDMGAYEYQHPPIIPDTVYVNINSTAPAADGSSWANAFNNLQVAMQYSCSTSHPHNVWVAAGTYIPTYDSTNRDAAFPFTLTGQKIYGGFFGTETALDARDSTGITNTTILSGEIQGDGNPYNNTWQVIFADNDSASEMNGFTITGGCGNDPGMNMAKSSGGGILNIEGNSTYSNIILRNNQAGWGGGFADFDGSPVLNRVTFVNDTSPTGGGMYIDGSGSFEGLSWVLPYSTDCIPLLTNDSFINCYTSFDGGGIFSTDGGPILDWVTFYNNSTVNYAGGMQIDNGSSPSALPHASVISHTKFISNFCTDTASAPYGAGLNVTGVNGSTTTLYDVLFEKNTGGPGAGIYAGFLGGGYVALNNVTFSGNKNITYGTGGYGIDGNDIYLSEGALTLRNSIVDSENNGNASFGGDLSQCTITYSLLPGSFPSGAIDSGGNLSNANPLFLDTSVNDCRLMSTSPAINVGNNSFTGGITVDLEGNPRITGGIVDMGAYEFCSSNASFTKVGTDTVAFTFTGSTSPDSIKWSFGDGSTSALANPTHIYTSGGTYVVCVTVYTSCGWDSSCSTVTITTAGVSGVNMTDVNIYPNPTTEDLNITGISTAGTYNIYNITGAAIQQGKLNAGANNVPLRGYSPGMYILDITGADGSRIITRVVKE